MKTRFSRYENPFLEVENYIFSDIESGLSYAIIIYFEGENI